MELKVIEPATESDAAIAALPSNPLVAMIERVVCDPSIDLDRLERVIALRDREREREAESAFTAAMAEFKRNPPKIMKGKHVCFTTQKGTTEYDHATLAMVCDAVCSTLSSYGLSHSWKTEQLDSGLIRVTCTLRHVGGHSESVTLMSGKDDSCGKNNIQAIGSAITYLQRYTLLAITGLATHDMPDDDGRGTETGDRGDAPETITPAEAESVEKLIKASGSDRAKFLQFVGAASVETISPTAFKRGMALLNQKLNAKKGVKP